MPPTILPPSPSSSLLSPPPSAPSQRYLTTSRPLTYHPPRALPFELAHHVSIYFEEALYAQSFSLLTSLLISNAASLSSSAYVPSPAHLALASTLSVHPSLTTRTRYTEKHEQSNAAFRLLRLTVKIVGPVGGLFNAAFAFRKFATTDESGQEHIDTPFALDESLWNRSEDFWQVVGWVGNCACLRAQPSYGARWERWRWWLEFMVSALEDDWSLRKQAGDESKSLVWAYIEQSSGGHGRNRRILRAVFADASQASLNEFREVFQNELKAPKADAGVKVKKRLVERINVEEEVYGDYMLEESSEEEAAEGARDLMPGKRRRTREPSTRRVTPRNSLKNLREDFEAAGGENDTLLGGTESLSLRLRLLQLLSAVSFAMPRSFIPLDDLYHMFIENIRPLSLQTFQLFISPSALSGTSADVQVTLCEKLLERMLESTAPGSEEAYFTQTKLVLQYLPYGSNKTTCVDNAKVSLLVESLLRHLALAKVLRHRQELERAVERGIEAREGKGRKGGKGDEKVAWAVLKESGQRMRDLVSRAGPTSTASSVGLRGGYFSHEGATELDETSVDDIDEDTVVGGVFTNVKAAEYPGNDGERFCLCQEPESWDMVRCHNDACLNGRFHLECVGLRKMPMETRPWYCPKCRMKPGMSIK